MRKPAGVGYQYDQRRPLRAGTNCKLMKISKLLLASAAIAAGSASFYAFVNLFPAQATAIIAWEKESQFPPITPARISGESKAPEIVAPNRNPHNGGARVTPSGKMTIVVAHELPSHAPRPPESESVQPSHQSPSSFAHSESPSGSPVREPLPGQLPASRALVAFIAQPQQTKPQQPRSVEPAPALKPQPPKSSTNLIPVTPPDAKSPEPTTAPSVPARAATSGKPVNFSSPENPPSADNPRPGVPRFYNAEAELYRTQYGEDAYAARMREAALSPAPATPER